MSAHRSFRDAVRRALDDMAVDQHADDVGDELADREQRGPTTHDLVEFWNRLWRTTTVTENGCWIWAGQINKGGYGQVSFLGRTVLAHRQAKILFGDPFNQQLQLDHLCRRRACWNPTHLDPCTQRTNILRGIGWSAVNAAKTHCPKGHLLSDDNLVQSKRPRRICLTCSLNQRIARTQRAHELHVPQHFSKLTEADVLTIRDRLATGTFTTYGALAVEFGIGRSTLYALRVGRAWSHIT